MEIPIEYKSRWDSVTRELEESDSDMWFAKMRYNEALLARTALTNMILADYEEIKASDLEA